MLHAAPTGEAKTETAQSKSQVLPLLERELHPHAFSAAGAYTLSGAGSAATVGSPQAQQRQTMTGMQSTHGNQAVLRMMRSSPQVTSMSALRPSQGMMLQRKCACGGSAEAEGECAECKAQREATLQRSVGNQAAPAAANTAPPIIHDVLSSSGQPLDAGTRAFMEPRFGHDFSQVRVHTDARAAESARAVNALAYTVGRNVVFGMGKYAPGTSEGKRLMAHELTHVMQQGEGGKGIQGKLEITDPSSTTEQEAQIAADAAMQNQSFISTISINTQVARQGAGDAGVVNNTQDVSLPDVAPAPPVLAQGSSSNPTPTAAASTPTTDAPQRIPLQDFIDIVKRIETVNPGKSALEIEQLIARTKYHSNKWDWLLPSLGSTSGPQVTAGGSVTSSDLELLRYKLVVILPDGGEAEPLHIVIGLVAKAETKAPGSGGTGGLLGRLASLIGTSLPSGVSQGDVATWLGDVGQAAAEWMTAHPLPSGGTTIQDYLNYYAPESDLLGDVDSIAMTSTSGAFVFDSSKPLSDNLQRFYFPAPGGGKFRRFHIFCAVRGFALEPDGVTLSSSAITTIDNLVKAFSDFFTRNDPSILLWVTMNGDSNAGFNPIWTQWIDRKDKWQWFAQQFRGFVQKNLNTEGP